MIEALSAPFPPAAIHWRAQAVTGSGDKALALAFIDARDVMDRLDEAVGPANWSDTYHETAKGRVICTLSICLDGVWVSKSDGAGDTAVEGEKGGISDAFKRAAVKWGIGRYLYDLNNVWAPCESRDNNGRKQWKKWAAGAPAVFERALADLVSGHAQASAPPPTITDDQQVKIIALCDASGVQIGGILKRAGVTDVRQIPAADFAKIEQALSDRIEAKKKETAQ